MARPRQLAGLAAAAGLGLAAGVHAAWAAGSTWPASSRDELADLVVGRRPFPSAVPTLEVSALLVGGAALVAAHAGYLEPLRRRAPGLTRLGANTVAAVLIMRAVAGVAISWLSLAETAEPFRKWNLRLYSPLCLALGVGSKLAARPHTI